MLVTSTALRRGFTQVRTSSHAFSRTRWLSSKAAGDKNDDDVSSVSNKGNAPDATFRTSSSLKDRSGFESGQGVEDLEEMSLRPSVVQKELDRHIVGQEDA